MRIGFDGKRYFHNKSGLGNYSRGLVRALAKYYPNNEYYIFDKNPPVQENENVKHIKGFGPGWWYRSFGTKISAQKNDIQVYHGLSNEIPFGMNHSKIKTVCSIHDLIFLKYPKQYPFVDRFFYNLKTAYAIRNSDKIIAISKQTKNDICEFYKTDCSKIEVVYQTCHPEFLIRNSEEEINLFKKKHCIPSDYLLYVSSFQERKNHSYLLEEYQNSNCKLPLVLAGNAGPTLEDCLKKINDLNIKNQVFIFNALSLKDLIKLYQGSHLFLYPSISEGFGIPLLEALESGIPTVSLNEPVYKEIVGEAGVYAQNKKGDFGAAIHLGLQNRDSLKQKTAVEKAKFTDKIMAKSIHKVYQNIV